ncbi:MAG TPA: hypothetical protein VM118_04630, partial [Acidobacteriota bacterium]|nr:hypothetical protein [Acidobacteriota bacterium]
MKSSEGKSRTRTALIITCVLATTGIAGNRPADTPSAPDPRLDLHAQRVLVDGLLMLRDPLPR